ncbi:MAG: gamma-glutamyl-gamma-aminobutyrate hydrolase family protein [Acidimicrobiales bacterium]
MTPSRPTSSGGWTGSCSPAGPTSTREPGEGGRVGGVATEPERDAWELELLRAALDADLPVLAICRGLQLLNVACGGTIVADIPAGAGDNHPRFGSDRHDLAHEVRFEPGSLAARVYGPAALVNSLHHQAVDRLGDGLVITGRSPDGTIEALELPGRPVLAVQWHPEAVAGDAGPAWLVEAARR